MVTVQRSHVSVKNEWSLFAERNGVDLIKVINAIKIRPTHSNMIFPGPGIGGYCLPKDGGLGYWACERRDSHPQPLPGSLLRTGGAGYLSIARKFVEALLPQPGGAETIGG